MFFRGIVLTSFVCLVLAMPAFGAEWYQSYEKGYKAVEKGKCAEGVPLLKEAVAKNPKPDLKARPYGMISWEYIPHYYLAKCAIEAGDFEGAKTYADQAMAVDMYSSSKSSEFRQIKKTLDEKFGTGKKPPTTTTPPVSPTNPQPTNPQPTKPPTTTTPQVNPSAARQAVVDSTMNEARMAYGSGDYAGAKDALDRVLVMDRGNAEAMRLKSQIAQKESASQAAQLKQQKMAEARRALSRGDLAAAENVTLELKSDFPDDRNVLNLADEIDRAKTEKMKSMQASDLKVFSERQVINAFYTGKYNAVIELADQAVKQFPDSWRLLFYQGCAYSALSILEDQKKDQRLSSARDSFRKAKSVAGSEITQPPQISPKIWDVYRSS